jgi:hypothetical protein
VQYVNDIVLSIREDEENLCNVINLLQLFILVKGLDKLVANQRSKKEKRDWTNVFG